MLPDQVLQDLWESALEALKGGRYVGINEKAFHQTSPEYPWGEEEVRAAAAYMTARGTPAYAVKLHYDDGSVQVTHFTLLVSMTAADLDYGLIDVQTEVDKTEHATLVVVDGTTLNGDQKNGI